MHIRSVHWTELIQLIALVYLSTSFHCGFALNLDNKFYDLFSLARIYELVKFGETAYLRTAYLDHHINEDTARLLYGLARSFARTTINSEADYNRSPFSITSLVDSVCGDRSHFNRHHHVNVSCHFQHFVNCVEGALQHAESCLSVSPARRSACPQAGICGQAYDNLVTAESLIYLKLSAQSSMLDLAQYRNSTPEQVAAMPKKSCLHDSQFLSAVFNFALCSELGRQTAFVKNRIIHPLAELFCPDPCLKNPCQRQSLRHQLVNTVCSSAETRWNSRHIIAHHWDDMALQLQEGLKPNYTCECRYGVWSSAKQACQHPSGGNYHSCSPTTSNRHFPCDAEGTSLCFQNSDSDEVTFMCRCKHGYTGVFCQERSNICQGPMFEVDLQGVSRRMSGNQLCNVNHDGGPLPNGTGRTNECQPDSDSKWGYNCTCRYPYNRIVSLIMDNCLNAHRACDSTLCINGECISTLDQATLGTCRCDNGWGGPMCNDRLNDWTVWSACSPVCGSNRTRKRERVGDNHNPGRIYAETELCPDRSCDDDTNEEDFMAYQTLLYSSSADSAILSGCVLLALLSFAGLRFWRPKFNAKPGTSAEVAR